MSDIQSSEIKAESPLIGRADAQHGANTAIHGGGVRLFERPFLGQISLRGREADPDFAAACAAVFGVDLPLTPNTFAEGDGIAVCWLGPTEWLILCERDARQSWLDGLREALASVHSMVTDLSGGQTLIAITGEHASDVLAKGTTLDVHPRVFGAGQCTRTILARATGFIRVIEPGRSFEIVVRRSYADYVWQWLTDAAAEYGCQVAAPQPSLPLTQAPQPREKIAAVR